MAFVKIERSRSGPIGVGRTPCVTMGSYLADGKRHKSKSVSFRISRALIDIIGWPIVDHTLFLSIHEGTDADKGFLQIVPDPQGRRTTQPTASQGFALAMIIDNFKHYVLNECPVSSTIVPHMIDDNALIVECPDWLRYNPQSVPELVPQRVTPLNREQRRAVASSAARSVKR